MPTEDAYSSGHLVLSHFGTCMCSNVETNLSWTCLVSGLLNFEHPSVLLFCFLHPSRSGLANWLRWRYFLLLLLLNCPPQRPEWLVSLSFSWFCLSECSIWVSVLVHPENVAQPSPAPMFHFFDDVVDARLSTDFPVDETLFPADPEYSSESKTCTLSLKAPESTFNLFVRSPRFCSK